MGEKIYARIIPTIIESNIGFNNKKVKTIKTIKIIEVIIFLKYSSSILITTKINNLNLKIFVFSVLNFCRKIYK